MKCSLCNGLALARYSMDAGCIARPDDRQQDLCGNHIITARPHGTMELVEVLHQQAYDFFMSWWLKER